ncbi:TIGR03618 family F420-dependent PPOX class oxidoreductase [Nocardia bovistercoris]|uniref:TIGR03618 family F420-dependent PPOX class oxidoreductase n=1 Tax=Nocardia bovistercoris TaxID=2785916 RepID=A0A931IEF2_9NOCA|nr:TIGR03618 family F420-dependent PPOX class oxidoreductase [Nocardia bovistercoris]MBH0779964.1 TIGR03618 family F420-dependent PPOX class oxidoreductase [Nocardia bovistercoris]
MRLDDTARALIGDGAEATLVTLNPGGDPQVSVVWVALRSTEDGDELVTAHLGEYKKVRNVRRDPRVAVTVLAQERDAVMRPYLAITGSARVVEGGAPELLADLAKTLVGPDAVFPPPDAPPGFLTRIRIEKVGGIGPWTS